MEFPKDQHLDRFYLLVNVLANATNLFSILFADDTTLQLSSCSLVSLYEQANLELVRLANWFKANKLTLNIGKTKYKIFKDKSKIVDRQLQSKNY